MTHHPVIRKRIAELQLEPGAQAERDGQRYSMTRRGMVELLTEIITSPSEKASSTILHVRCATLVKRGE